MLFELACGRVYSRIQTESLFVFGCRLEHEFEALLFVVTHSLARASVPRNGYKALRRRHSAVIPAFVPVRTVPLPASLSISCEPTDACLPDCRMVLLLLPAVALLAAVFVATAIDVFSDEALCLPVLAEDGFILEFRRLPPQILPVVGVNALFLVVLKRERTPSGFEVEHVEVGVWLHPVEKVNGKLLLGVSKGTEMGSVLT